MASCAATTCRIFYDTETSGFGDEKHKQHRIMELAAVADGWTSITAAQLAASGLTRGSSYETEFPAGCFAELICVPSVSECASMVHGILLPEVQGCPSFEEVWTRFVQFVHEAQRRMPESVELSLIGHNSHFSDNYCLLSELSRCGRSISELLLPKDSAKGQQRLLIFEDTYPNTKYLKALLLQATGLTNYTNEAFYNFLACESLEGHGAVHASHSALWDAAATRDVWRGIPAIRCIAAERRKGLEWQRLQWESLQLKNKKRPKSDKPLFFPTNSVSPKRSKSATPPDSEGAVSRSEKAIADTPGTQSEDQGQGQDQSSEEEV